MRFEELTQLRWGDAANYICEIHMEYGSAKLNFPAVVNHQMDTIAATPYPKTFGKHMQTLEIANRQSDMPAVTC